MNTYPPSHHASQATLLAEYPTFTGDLRFDACVVGAGYTGLSTALHLAESGYKVALVEAERVGWGASGRNGGQLGHGMTVLQTDLIRQFGEEAARRFWAISVEAVDLFHALCRQHAIQCDFQSGNMACAITQANLDELNHHADIVDSYGDNVYSRHDQAQTQHLTGSSVYKGGILAHKAGHINPLKYALGLTKAAEYAGVEIFENSRVKRMDLSDPVKLTLDAGTIIADYAVVACNGYLGKLNNTLANRILPIDNYQVTTEPLDKGTLNTLIKDGICVWDTSKSVHYYRLTPDDRLVMGCSIGVPGHPPRKLEKDCRKHLEYIYPALKNVKLDFIWGGTIAGTSKQLPDTGRLAPNILYAQGYTGHGVGLAPLMGKYMAQAIQGESAGFEFMAGVKHKSVPGGRFLRVPAVLAYRFMTNTLDRVIRF